MILGPNPICKAHGRHEKDARINKKGLFGCGSVYHSKKKKKDTTEKKSLVFRKNTIPKWKTTCLIFLLLLLAVAGVTRPAANIPEPLVLGRMFGCQLHGGEEQWLFNLLFIAKPIWEE